MSITGGFIAISESFMKSCNYINNKNEHPESFFVIYSKDLVFKKEELNDKNWLYIGEESEEKNKVNYPLWNLLEESFQFLNKENNENL